MNNTELKLFKYNFSDFDIFVFDHIDSLSSVGVEKAIKRDEYKLDEINFQKGDNFIDIGGHCGLVSFYAAKKFPNVNFHIFECNPIMVSALQLGSLKNKLNNILIYPFALSDSNKKCKFNVQFENTGGSGFTQNPFHKSCFDVNVYDFETILSVFEKIKYLKIDIEGEEFKIFEKLINTNSNFFNIVENLNLEAHDKIYASYGYSELDKKVSRQDIIKYLSNFKNLDYEILE